jgi:hypothetical protein
MLLTYNLISGILVGASISILERFIGYIAYIGVWLLASQYKVFRKIIGFGLGILGISLSILPLLRALLHAGHLHWSDLDWGMGVFCYVGYVFAISPDVDAYLKKRPNKSIKSNS